MAYATIADDNGRATMRQLFGDVAETFVGMGGAAAAAPAAPSSVEQLKLLADLHAQGALTDEEFAGAESQVARLSNDRITIGSGGPTGSFTPRPA